MSAPVKEDAGPRIAAVEADFPGWHAYQTNAGRWMAVRTASRARWEKWVDVPATVDCADENELRAELEKYPQKEDGH